MTVVLLRFSHLAQSSLWHGNCSLDLMYSWNLRLTKNILRDNFINAQYSAQVPESYKVLVINLCGKCDSAEKRLNWSSSLLEVGFSVCCVVLYFQILILGAWIFIRKLLSNYQGSFFVLLHFVLVFVTSKKKMQPPSHLNYYLREEKHQISFLHTTCQVDSILQAKDINTNSPT